LPVPPSSTSFAPVTPRRSAPARHAGRWVGVVLAVALGVVAQGQLPAQAAGDSGRPAAAAQPQPARGRSAVTEPARKDPTADKRMTRPDKVAWPILATRELEVAAANSPANVGGLPVQVLPVRTAGASTRSAQATPQRARVHVYDRGAATRAGIDGPVFTVSRSDGGDNAAARISVGYGGFAHAFGGDWGARLRLVTLPACALTTPEQAACRTVTPLASVNDVSGQAVTADVDLAATGSDAKVLALSAGVSSSQGAYTATKLSPSSSWQTQLSSGGFSWNYPVRVPTPANGFTPTVGLAYSSQAVDGRTSATNNQGSWIGEGFTFEPGYIERRYKPCADDGHQTSGDQCWAFHNGTVMMAGRSGALVKISDNSWKLSQDDGSKVERLTGAVNGDNDGEYWKLTATDGSQYFFGLNRLPGWTTGKTATDSVWSAPVYGDDTGEPCHQSSGFADSHCDQAWRWNLDYAIDPRGNVISYYYARETNHYARGGRTDVDGVRYDRGGYLTRIDYGQRDGEVYASAAPARVQFDTVERCIPSAGVGCDPADLDESTAASWPDVPVDLICAAGTHCKDVQRSPTFFTRKRLVSIRTEIRTGATWTPVESWDLEHDFKVNDDNSRTLWLKKITRNGHWGGATMSLPPTELDGIQLPNRIVPDGDNLGPLIRYRLATVKTDTGAQITINYKAPDCTKDNLPTAGHSTLRCYPVIWNPLGGDDEDKATDWFHKYVVDSVVTDDLVGGNPDMVAAYQYVGTPAWRKADPDGITETADLTWSDWRGYPQVTVRTGDGQNMPTRTDHFFMRGMSGAKKADGSTPAVSVTDSTGKTFTDHDELSGFELESIVYNGSEIVSKSVNEPWRVITRTQTESWGELKASMVDTGVARELVALPDDAQGQPRWRETQVASKRDSWGRVVEFDDLGEVGPGKDGDDRCVRTWYADNPDLYLYFHVSRVQTVSVKCAVTSPNLSTQLLADTRTSYDLQAWGEAPVKGTPTRTETLDQYDGADVRYVRDSETTALDGYGRPLSSKNALDGRTLYEYVDVDGFNAQTKTTNEIDHASTTVIDPGYGVVTTVFDANGKRTDMQYDPLGRLTAVWLADQDKAQGAKPNLKFGYQIRRDRTSVVTSERLLNDGSYRTTHELFDGLLRGRQTQAPGPGGGWLLTDTFYLGTGQEGKSNATYLALGTAGDTPIIVPEGSVNGQTSTIFDGADRPIVGIFSVAGDTKWVTTTSYEGDRINVDPPAGAIPTTLVHDARGKNTELHQYHGEEPTGPADVTRYTYTPAGSLSTVTDPLGTVWRNHYNQRNLKVLVEDPDAGDSTYTYDKLDRLTSTTDSRNIKLSHRYDAIGRRTQTWQGDLDTGTKLAAWFYDNAGNKGQLHYSQRIVEGQNYYTINLTRDALYRPMTVRYSFPAAGSGGVGSLLGKSYDFTTAYNTDGTVRSIGMPAAGGLAAEAVAQTYDSLLRPTTLTGLSSYVTSTLYGNLGELLQVELFTGGTDRKAWLNYEVERGTGRLSKVKVNRQGVAVVDMAAEYQHDPAGNVLSISDTPPGGGRDVQCFEYDHLQRLIEAWSTASSTNACADGVAQTGVGGPAPYHHSWTFDAVGNRDVETIHSPTGGTDTVRDYTFPAPGQGQNQPHTLTGVEEVGPGGSKSYRYSYDAAGNTTCRPAGGATNNCTQGGLAAQQTLSWDAEGHLATSTPTGGLSTTYVYDADGNRIARKDPGGNTTLYLPGMELAQVGTVVSGTRHYGFAGRTVAVRTTSGVFFQVADHHGTASCAINAATGAIAWRRTTPYGADRQSPAFWPDTKGFVGGTRDLTGLTHLGAREYDPALGRFASVDPLVDFDTPGELGGYAYARNNPVTHSDPSGRATVAGGVPWVPNPGTLHWSQTGFTRFSDTTTGNVRTVVDQNGVPHVLGGKVANPAEQAALDQMNQKLAADGHGYDPTTGTGTRYELQDATATDKLMAKGSVVGPDGKTVARGTTTDYVKITYVNGKVVNVDAWDATSSNSNNPARNALDDAEATIRKKLDLSSNKGAKKQAQYVVYVAKSDAEAIEMQKRFANDPRVRIINPATGFDTGDIFSASHLKALATARAKGLIPRGPAAAGTRPTGGGTVGKPTPKVVRGAGMLDLLAGFYFMGRYGENGPCVMYGINCNYYVPDA
jgi:RHS repeat-associated protein